MTESQEETIKRLEARVKELEIDVKARKKEVQDLQIARAGWNRRKARRLAREMVDSENERT